MTRQPASFVEKRQVESPRRSSDPAGYSVAVSRTRLEAIDLVSVRAGEVSNTAGSS
jgi:hypothetical protein